MLCHDQKITLWSLLTLYVYGKRLHYWAYWLWEHPIFRIKLFAIVDVPTELTCPCGYLTQLWKFHCLTASLSRPEDNAIAIAFCALPQMPPKKSKSPKEESLQKSKPSAWNNMQRPQLKIQWVRALPPSSCRESLTFGSRGVVPGERVEVELWSRR